MPIHPVRSYFSLFTLEIRKTRNRSSELNLFVRHIFSLDL